MGWQRKVTPVMERLINEKQEQGMAIWQIAEEFGLSQKTVSKYARGDRRRGKRSVAISDEVHQEINALYDSGMTIVKVARMLNMAPSSVGNHIENPRY